MFSFSKIKKHFNRFISSSNCLNIVTTGNSSTIVINGVKYSGNNVTVRNNKVYVDDVLQEQVFDRDIQVTVNGDVDKLDLNVGDITVNGNISSGINISTGDVECRDVTGDIKISCGDIKCGKVTGNVSTSCGDIN